jgi:Uma2 family endonuclease
MSTATAAPVAAEPYGGMTYMRRFTLDEYHELIRANILTEEDPVELLEGYLVLNMPRSPEHDFAIRTLNTRLVRLVPDTFTVSNQCAATLTDDSEPEPDFTVARGNETTYRGRHPAPADMALVIEVSASSLARDRGEKARIYARAGIPVYWIVNVEDKQIEVLTQPSGPGDAPAYARREVFAVGTSAPVVLDGVTVGTVAVADIMG